MSKHYEINEKWIKASIVGTIWAASEIVLGSFLHNLKIPFSSNLLTGIGIIILISTSYKWTERGLFWRSGLICALMKTMSPSAVIFGPMIAIFCEAFLIEIFTGIFGRNIIGFALGGMFAMTWNLFHKIMNFIIFYGFNIVNIYAGLLKYAQKQLGINFDLVWSPIIVLALIYCLMGLLSAVIGIKAGKRLIKQPNGNKLPDNKIRDSLYSRKGQEFNYSAPWLIIDTVLIIVAFVLLNFGTLIIWSTAISAIVTIWVIRYKRALRQLSRPRFWVWFVIITMLTAFVINKIQAGDLENGLITGIQMNFRAAIVILGFSVLGTELYNPKIREFFMKTSFKQLPLALELSFESLPVMIASVPEFREIRRNPVSVIYHVISQIEYRLEEVKEKLAAKVYIITGTIGQGKTTQVKNIVDNLKSKNIQVSGFYSPRIMENGITNGYDIVDIETNLRIPFLRKSETVEFNKTGHYSILQEGLSHGIAVLAKSVKEKISLVVIDEVGKLELNDKGWSDKISVLINISPILIFAVRDTFTEQVIQKWDIKSYSVYNVTDDLHKDLTNIIMEHLN